MTTTVVKEGMLYQKLQEVIDEKRGLRDPLIEILREAQEIFGYLPIEVQQYISDELGLPIGRVYGVVTFYNFFYMEPRGKHVIDVCTGTACFVKGADRLLDILCEELDAEPGGTSADGLFTVSSVRCVGACSLAPVLVIGEDTFGRVDSRKKVKQIIKKYRDMEN